MTISIVVLVVLILTVVTIVVTILILVIFVVVVVVVVVIILVVVTVVVIVIILVLILVLVLPVISALVGPERTVSLPAFNVIESLVIGVHSFCQCQQYLLHLHEMNRLRCWFSTHSGTIWKDVELFTNGISPTEEYWLVHLAKPVRRAGYLGRCLLCLLPCEVPLPSLACKEGKRVLDSVPQWRQR